MSEENGFHECPLYKQWDQLRTRAEAMERRVSDMHEGFESLGKQTTALETIANCLTEVKDKLLDSAIGRKHVDLWTFGIVVGTLVLIIAFLLTGEGAGFIRLLHHPGGAPP